MSESQTQGYADFITRQVAEDKPKIDADFSYDDFIAANPVEEGLTYHSGPNHPGTGSKPTSGDSMQARAWRTKYHGHPHATAATQQVHHNLAKQAVKKGLTGDAIHKHIHTNTGGEVTHPEVSKAIAKHTQTVKTAKTGIKPKTPIR